MSKQPLLHNSSFSFRAINSADDHFRFVPLEVDSFIEASSSFITTDEICVLENADFREEFTPVKRQNGRIMQKYFLIVLPLIIIEIA